MRGKINPKVIASPTGLVSLDSSVALAAIELTSQHLSVGVGRVRGWLSDMFGAPALPAYAAAKAAIVGFTNSLARLVGPDRIRVNAIAPGTVITDRHRRLWYPDEKQIAEFRARQAIPDAVTPDDIARLALFLASDENQRVTRQCFQVDGGPG
jgi:NAD(P)-dependent dehydrogenase (short-subunit alcohol dehydrogenase family)